MPTRYRDAIRTFRHIGRPVMNPVLDVAMALVAGIALFSLVADFGFSLDRHWDRIIHSLDLIAVFGYISIRATRMFFSTDPRRYLRSHRLDLVLLGVFAASYGLLLVIGGVDAWFEVLWYFTGQLDIVPSQSARVYINLTKAYIFITSFVTAAKYVNRLLQAQFRPVTSIILSFGAVIGVGSFLLTVPNANVSSDPMPYLDALFTAVSAVCVTGLIVVDTPNYFSTFGHVVLLALIQIGGLGYMTLTAFTAVYVTSGGSLRERTYIRDLLNDSSIAAAKTNLRRIIIYTVVIELVGAVCLYFFIPPEVARAQSEPRWFYAVFHSVSAFCNAGFALWSDSLAGEAIRFSVPLNVTIMALIICGGLGFAVLSNLVGVAGNWRRRGRRRVRLSLQSKLVLIISTLLIVFGYVAYHAMELRATLEGLEPGEQIVGSIFQSVSTRTAGFNTLDLARITTPTALIMIMLMMIGASPGGTGGGVKTTTVGVAFLSAVATARGQKRIELFHRRIPDETVYQATSVMLFGGVIVMVSLFLLTITEASVSLIHLFFEEVSAFATVGLSMGVTGSLSPWGKGIIIVSMFLGRVGPMTIAIALSQPAKSNEYDYPTEQLPVM
ncbi:MAG: hypothetical protein O3A46_03480 [Candidatus Poribacteria bacterium]|nr:hypothetical protein [Candidatus Poribacteria bacterium]